MYSAPAGAGFSIFRSVSETRNRDDFRDFVRLGAGTARDFPARIC
jgi:hypothetical protein